MKNAHRARGLNPDPTPSKVDVIPLGAPGGRYGFAATGVVAKQYTVWIQYTGCCHRQYMFYCLLIELPLLALSIIQYAAVFKKLV